MSCVRNRVAFVNPFTSHFSRHTEKILALIDLLHFVHCCQVKLNSWKNKWNMSMPNHVNYLCCDRRLNSPKVEREKKKTIEKLDFCSFEIESNATTRIDGYVAKHKIPLLVWIGPTCVPFALWFPRAPCRSIETKHFPIELVVVLMKIPTACVKASERHRAVVTFTYGRTLLFEFIAINILMIPRTANRLLLLLYRCDYDMRYESTALGVKILSVDMCICLMAPKPTNSV